MSGSKTLSTSDTKLEALSLQSSAYGVTVPLLFLSLRSWSALSMKSRCLPEAGEAGALPSVTSREANGLSEAVGSAISLSYESDHMKSEPSSIWRRSEKANGVA